MKICYFYSEKAGENLHFADQLLFFPYFCICVDVGDNNLAYLEAIHNFVEVLNEYFHNVCELDLVFNFYKVYAVVDEMFLAGEIRETSQQNVIRQLQMLQNLE